MKRVFPSTVLLALLCVPVVVAVTPGPPQNLTATVSGNNVTFAWEAPSTGGVPSGYILEAALSPGGVLIASLPVSGSPLTVPTVPNGVYYVAVRALNADGASERSNEVLVSVPGGGGGSCASVPNPPQNLSGGASGNTVTLAWAAPSGGCASTSYVVQAGSGPGLTDITVANVGASTLLTASAPARTYYIRVIALNVFGGSAPSNEVAVTVAPPTPNPSPTPGTCGPVAAACGPATARCNDGSYSCSQNRSGTCSWQGGVSCWVCPGTLCSPTAGPTPPPPPPPTSRYRIGARCRDGSLSSATGSGACSHHGGVSCWRYNDGTCTMPDERDPFEVVRWENPSVRSADDAGYAA